MLATWVHDLNPYLVRFGSSSYGIRWYGLAYLLGFVAGYYIVTWLTKPSAGRQLRMPTDRVPDLALAVCIFGVLIGGRLGYCLFYPQGHSLLGFTSEFPYWGVFKVWEGGMAAHGGVAFTILTIIFWSRKNKFSVINVGDAVCMVVPLGLMFGRIANFINGELYGRVLAAPDQPAPWFAVKFPTEIVNGSNNAADPRVDQALVDNVIAAVNSHIRHVDSLKPGIDLNSLTRNSDLIELIRKGDTFARDQIATILPARHPSQLYEALLEGLLLFLIVWFVGRRWRKDGIASGAFLTFYPVFRIICESFRVGDDPWDWLKWTHLSAGVLLSIPMFVIGVSFWIYFMRKPPVAHAPPAEEPVPAAPA